MKLERLIPLLIDEAKKSRNSSKKKGEFEFCRTSDDLKGAILQSPGYFAHLKYMIRADKSEFLNLIKQSPNGILPLLTAESPPKEENQFVIDVQGTKYAIVTYHERMLDDTLRRWNFDGNQPRPKKVPVYIMGASLLSKVFRYFNPNNN